MQHLETWKAEHLIHDLKNTFYRGDGETIAAFKKALTSKDTSEVKRLVQTKLEKKYKIELEQLDTAQMQTLIEVFDYPLDRDTDLLDDYIKKANNDDLCFLFVKFPYWWKHSDDYGDGEQFRIGPDDGPHVTVFSENGLNSLRKKIKRMIYIIKKYERSTRNTIVQSRLEKNILSLSHCFVVGLQKETDSIIYQLGHMIELPEEVIGHSLHNPDNGIRVARTREHFENISSSLSIPEAPLLNSRTNLEEYQLSPIWEHSFPYRDEIIWVPSVKNVYRLVAEFLGPHVSPSIKIWIDFIKFKPATLDTLRSKYKKLLKKNKYMEYNACVSSIQLVKASDYLKHFQQTNEESDALRTKLKILNNVFRIYKSRRRKLKEEFIKDALDEDSLVLIFDYDT